MVAWYCSCGHRNEGDAPTCLNCTRKLHERYAQIRANERAVVYVNPLTGERRTPPRADQPMPEVYARQGFERQEIMSMSAFEKQTGLVHEATNFNPGSEPMPEERHAPDPAMRQRAIDAAINEVRAAHQSGPWTLDTPLADVPFGS